MPKSLFDPAQMSSGGFLSATDAVITAARVVTQDDTPFDAQDEDSTFLEVEFTPDEEGSEPKKEYYRFGSVEKFTPSTDRTRVMHDENTSLNKSTKGGLFFHALINAGFPVVDLPAYTGGGEDVSFLVGLHVHVDRVPMKIEGKAGKNYTPKKDKDGNPVNPEVVLVTKLLEKKGAAKAAGKSKAKPAAAGAASAPAASTTSSAPAVAADGDAVQEAATAAVLAILKEKGTAQKRLLPTEFMRRIEKPLQPAAFKLINDAGFLPEGPWSFDAGTGEVTPNETTAALLEAQG